MDIRGITKFSLVDFPGKISCIIFVGKCNFRCPFCHNPYLVLYHESQPKIPDKEIFRFLERRKGKLDGVVISGGEPTLYGGLADFAKHIKDMGFAVKLDTNGSFPDRVIEMCENGLVDMLGIDYKATEENYQEVADVKIKGLAGKIQQLIKYAVETPIPYDIRTTVHKKYHSQDDLRIIRFELNKLGVKDWTLQQFHPAEIIDEKLLDEETYSDFELFAITKKLGDNTHLRGVTTK